MWRSTAIKLKIPAKTPEIAWDKGWKLTAKMMGGMEALEVKVMGQIS